MDCWQAAAGDFTAADFNDPPRSNAISGGDGKKEKESERAEGILTEDVWPDESAAVAQMLELEERYKAGEAFGVSQGNAIEGCRPDQSARGSAHHICSDHIE